MTLDMTLFVSEFSGERKSTKINVKDNKLRKNKEKKDCMKII